MPEWRDMNDVLREADAEATNVEAVRATQLERERSRNALTCPACGVQHETPADLRAHFLAEHEGIPEFVCPDCKEVFDSKAALNGHKSKHRPKPNLADVLNGRPPKGPVEPEPMNDSAEIVIRQPDSPLHDLATIVCLVTGCDFESEVKLDVQRHVAQTHPKCEPCGSRLFDGAALAEHQAICRPYKDSLIPDEPEPVEPVFGPGFGPPIPPAKSTPVFGPGIAPPAARPQEAPATPASGAINFRVHGEIRLYSSHTLKLTLTADGSQVWDFSRLVDLLVAWENEWVDK